MQRVNRLMLMSVLSVLGAGTLAWFSPQGAAAVTPDVSFAHSRSYNTGPKPQQVAVADLNGDGFLDVATANYGSRTVSVLQGRGDGSFGSKRGVRAGLAHPLALTAADLNNDGAPDLAVVNGGGTDRVAVLIGDGTGRFGTKVYRGGQHAQAISSADVNGDGDIDLITANGTGGVSILLGKGDGTFKAATDRSTRSTMCSGVSIADLDDDGNPDLVTANSFLGQGASNHSVSVLMGRGDGTFARAILYRHVGTQPTMVAIADLNEDGSLDLVTPNGGWPTHDLSLMFGNGDGTFQPPVHRAGGPSPHDVAAVDLNGDGHTDLAVTNLGTSYVSPTNQGLTVRLGKGDGSFGPKISIENHWPTSIDATDLNGDGRMDLLVPNESSSTLAVLRNTTT
jgi:FG-GAP-like repeat